MRAPRPLLAALLLALPLAGCVERKFLIRSDPEGAVIRVNGVERGTTPLEIDFAEYGVIRLQVDPIDVDGDGFPEYDGLVGPFELEAPWYQWFPIDFVSDNLWPGTLEVRREAILVLPPALNPFSETDTAIMRSKIPAVRARAEKMRLEENATPPEPKR